MVSSRTRRVPSRKLKCGKYFRSHPSDHVDGTKPSVETVRWVAEDKRPFSIVADKRFRVLMKTGPGRHGQYVPSPATVGRDVRRVFVATRKRIATMLQVSPCLSLSK